MENQEPFEGEESATERMAGASHVATERAARVAHEAIDRMAETSGRVEERVRDAGARTAARSREFSDSVVDYVDHHPIAALGIAAAAGFILSSLMRRG